MGRGKAAAFGRFVTEIEMQPTSIFRRRFTSMSRNMRLVSKKKISATFDRILRITN